MGIQKVSINKLFATVAISMGQRLKRLYDEVYKQDQSKSPDEVLAILEKLHLLCEELEKQYSTSGPYLTILLNSAGESASLYFRQYSQYLKQLHHIGATSKKKMQDLNTSKQSVRASYIDKIPTAKSQPIKHKILESHPHDQQIGKHISEYSLFNRYHHAKEGSVEYIKNDFMSHYDPSKHSSIDEFLLERSQELKITPAKYKEDLIHGTQSKMEVLVNLIEPGWSKEPPPLLEINQTILSQPPNNKNLENYPEDPEIKKHISEYSLFNKYHQAVEGSIEYVKNDFMNHYDSSKYRNLNEFLLERSQELNISPAKYKEDLIHGTQSKMEMLVNLIEPGWSKEPPPTTSTDGDQSSLKSK